MNTRRRTCKMIQCATRYVAERTHKLIRLAKEIIINPRKQKKERDKRGRQHCIHCNSKPMPQSAVCEGREGRFWLDDWRNRSCNKNCKDEMMSKRATYSG